MNLKLYQTKAKKYVSGLSPKLTLSPSQVTTWQRCRMRWYWIYVEDCVPTTTSMPLIVGGITHVLRELWLQDIHNETPQKNFNEEVLSRLEESIQAQYDCTEEEARFASQESLRLIRVYLTELAGDPDFTVHHPELQLEKDFGDYILYARLDGLARDKHQQRLYRDELKTTSRMDSQYLGGYRRGLQTGICHLLMQDLLPEKTYGSLFEILAKTQIAQAKRQAVPLDKWQVEYTRITVDNEAKEILAGRVFPSLQCHMYNKMCEYKPLCQASLSSTKGALARAKTLYNSRKEEFKRRQKAQLFGVPIFDKDGMPKGN